MTADLRELNNRTTDETWQTIIQTYRQWLVGRTVTEVAGDSEYVRFTVDSGATIEFRYVGMGYEVRGAQGLPDPCELSTTSSDPGDLAQVSK